MAVPGSTKLFDSSQIPGEIIDMMVVNSTELTANPAFGKALVGAWYPKPMAIIAGSDDAAKAARTAMGPASGTDLAASAQLAATRMFFRAAEAVSFATADLVATMDSVRKFSDAHGLLERAGRGGHQLPGSDERWATAAI